MAPILGAVSLTRVQLPALFRDIAKRDDSDVIAVTWHTPFNRGAEFGFSSNQTFLPHSTWTQGRNRLLQLGLGAPAAAPLRSGSPSSARAAQSSRRGRDTSRVKFATFRVRQSQQRTRAC